MAWGQWKTYWLEVAKTSNWKLEEQFEIRQDAVANKSEYRVTQLRLTKLKSFTIYNLDSAKAGIAVLGENHSKQERKINLDFRTATVQTYNLPNDSREFEHDTDGKITGTKNIHYMLEGGVSSSYNPSFSWGYKNINSYFEDIDTRAMTTTCEVVSTSYQSAVIKITSTAKTKERGRYKINGGNWKYFEASSKAQSAGGGSTNVKIDGLKPNTKYSIVAQYQRALNEKWNVSGSTTFETTPPNLPTAGKITVSDITTNSCVVNMDGFRFAEASTWGHYEYRTNSGAWLKLESKVNTHTIKGLIPNAEYLLEVRLVNDYGGASSVVRANFKTFEDVVLINYIKGAKIYKSPSYLLKSAKYRKIKNWWIYRGAKWHKNI